MPDLHVSFVLPYYLRLPAGEYRTGSTGEDLEVVAPELIENEPPRTCIRARFGHEDSITDANAIQQLKTRDASRLLWRTNRLLRWYRCVSHRGEILELTRAQASPFRFEVFAGAGDPAWQSSLSFERTGAPLSLPSDELVARVRDGLASGNEPDVADLFLLDAERALHQGRFREAVLFSWSTIDSVFNRKYDLLVATALVGEWAAARDFFTGVDFGLKNKMTAALYLVAQRSLYRETGDFWSRLSGSYTRRNGIIHRGETATEDEARQAIVVARQVVEIMNTIPVSAVGGEGAAPRTPPAPPPAPDPPANQGPTKTTDSEAPSEPKKRTRRPKS